MRGSSPCAVPSRPACRPNPESPGSPPMRLGASGVGVTGKDARMSAPSGRRPSEIPCPLGTEAEGVERQAGSCKQTEGGSVLRQFEVGVIPARSGLLSAKPEGNRPVRSR